MLPVPTYVLIKKLYTAIIFYIDGDLTVNNRQVNIAIQKKIAPSHLSKNLLKRHAYRFVRINYKLTTPPPFTFVNLFILQGLYRRNYMLRYFCAHTCFVSNETYRRGAFVVALRYSFTGITDSDATFCLTITQERDIIFTSPCYCCNYTDCGRYPTVYR